MKGRSGSRPADRGRLRFSQSSRAHKTVIGQQETFDTGGGIADNLESHVLQFAERSNHDRRH